MPGPHLIASRYGVLILTSKEIKEWLTKTPYLFYIYIWDSRVGKEQKNNTFITDSDRSGCNAGPYKQCVEQELSMRGFSQWYLYRTMLQPTKQVTLGPGYTSAGYSDLTGQQRKSFYGNAIQQRGCFCMGIHRYQQDQQGRCTSARD